MNTTPTPNDTGTRLTPNPWVRMGITGIDNPRPAEPDDYGRVDFEDAEGANHLIAYAAVDQEGTTLHVEPGTATVLNVAVHTYGPGREALVTVRVTEDGEVTVTNHATEQGPETSVSVTLAADVTDDDIDAIMDTAVDGVDYWTNEFTTTGNGTWAIADAAYDQVTVHTVTRADIRRAIELAASPDYRALDVDADVHSDILAAMQAPDADGFDVGEIDATAADQLVQLAALGTVSYA